MKSATETNEICVPGVSLFGKIFLWLGFFGLTPAFIWIWIDNPKFVQGPIDGPEILMGVITVPMLALCVMMPAMAQSWTRVSASGLETRFVRRHAIRFEEIEAVVSAVQIYAVVINVCVAVRIKLKSGKTREFYIATPVATRTLLNILEVYVPGAANTRIVAHHVHG